MNTVQINFRSMELGYDIAAKLATSCARREYGLKNAAIVAWRDKLSSSTFPPQLEGSSDPRRWHVYGETHGGKLEVGVNGEFDFIFADTSDFEALGPSPYVSMPSQSGGEMLCPICVPRVPGSINTESCIALDDWASKQT